MQKTKCASVVFVLFSVQPLLDVLSYWTQGITLAGYMTLALRMGILLIFLTLGFVRSKRRWIYYVSFAAVALFYLLHALACRYAGSFGAAALMQDLTNYIRVLQFLLLTLALRSIFAHDRSAWNAAWRGSLTALGLIALVALLSRLTGTDPTTYSGKQIGLLGWFYTPSCQSAILSALVPLAFCTALRRSKGLSVAVILIGTALLYLNGTRLTYVCALIALAGTLISWLLCCKLDVLRGSVLILCIVACLAGYFVSPMMRNQTLVAQNAVKKQVHIDALVAQGRQEFPEDETKALEAAYCEYLPGLVDRFGVERVASYYHYSTKAADLCDARRMKRSYCELLMQDAPQTSKLFGLSFSEMRWGEDSFDVENDLHGIYYLYGWVGLCAFLLMLAFCALRILLCLLRDARTYFTPEAAACGIALCTLALHIYFTSGVLRRPNSSIYLSFVLAGIWLLTKKRKETEKE